MKKEPLFCVNISVVKKSHKKLKKTSCPFLGSGDSRTESWWYIFLTRRYLEIVKTILLWSGWFSSLEILLKCTSQHSNIKSLRTGIDRWASLSSYVTSGKIILVAECWMHYNVSLLFLYVKLYHTAKFILHCWYKMF